MENKILSSFKRKTTLCDLFWKCQRIHMALERVLKPGVGITSLSFGAFLGKLGFNQAKRDPFLQTRRVSGAACWFSITAHAAPSQGGRAHYTGNLPSRVPR